MLRDTRRAAAAGLLAAVALAAAACGSGKPEAVPAGGKVSYRKSKAPAGALVVFHPTDPASEKRIGGKPFARVAEDGTFKLGTYGEGDGAPEGEYGVTIDWRGKGTKTGLGLGDGAGAGAPLLQAKYSDPRTPPFKVKVKRGEPNEFTFDVD